MQYDLTEHRHRYSIWTAARAVQRSFTKTWKISKVINETDLRSFAETASEISDQNQFDSLQKRWCNEIIDGFAALDVAASYGQASKIIAVYLKTSVIMRSDLGQKHLAVIHPPIDRIVLKSLPRISSFSSIKKINWTTMDQSSYWQLVDTIRSEFGFFDWRLEIGWTPDYAID